MMVRIFMEQQNKGANITLAKLTETKGVSKMVPPGFFPKYKQCEENQALIRIN